MSDDVLKLIIFDLLFVAIVAGWIVLIVAGIEPDAPLSGGLPGRIDAHEASPPTLSRRDRIGELLGWVLFGVVSLALPFVLYWIWTVHGGAS